MTLALKTRPPCGLEDGVAPEPRGRRLCEDLLIIYFELPKDRKERKAGRTPRNKLERWLSYLDGLRGEEMSQIALQEPKIGEALTLEREFPMDEDV